MSFLSNTNFLPPAPLDFPSSKPRNIQFGPPRLERSSSNNLPVSSAVPAGPDPKTVAPPSLVLPLESSSSCRSQISKRWVTLLDFIPVATCKSAPSLWSGGVGDDLTPEPHPAQRAFHREQASALEQSDPATHPATTETMGLRIVVQTALACRVSPSIVPIPQGPSLHSNRIPVPEVLTSSPSPYDRICSESRMSATASLHGLLLTLPLPQP